MRGHILSRLDLLKGLPYPTMLLKSMCRSVILMWPKFGLMSRLCCLLMTWWCSWPVPWIEAMFMSLRHAAPGDHTDVKGLCCQWGWYVGLWSYCSWICVDVHVYTTTESRIDVSGLCHNQKPCWCPVASESLIQVQSPTATMSPVCILCWYQKAIGSLWYHALTVLEEQIGDVCNSINDYRCTVKKERRGRLLWQHLPIPQHIPHKIVTT